MILMKRCLARRLEAVVARVDEGHQRAVVEGARQHGAHRPPAQGAAGATQWRSKKKRVDGFIRKIIELYRIVSSRLGHTMKPL